MKIGIISGHDIPNLIKNPEKIENYSDRIEEALTVFTAVEKIDEKNPRQTVLDAAKDIGKTADQLKVKNIMLYPYAHLSSDLANPKKAQEVLIEIEYELKNKSYNVKRSPFGWYKAFKISCKGHPLSELAREIRIGELEGAEAGEMDKDKGKEEIVSKAVKAEEELISEWYILDVEGNHGVKR